MENLLVPDARPRSGAVIGVLAGALLVAGCTGHASAAMKAPTGSAARSYRVVALGDSVPAGFSCDCSNFVTLYAVHAQQDTGVATRATNDAEPSALSGGVLAQLQGSSDVARAVARADFVVVNVGANDFAQDRVGYEQGACGGADHLGCFRPQLPRMHDNLVRILQRIRSLVGARPVAIRVVDYGNVFEDGDVGRATGGPLCVTPTG